MHVCMQGQADVRTQGRARTCSRMRGCTDVRMQGQGCALTGRTDTGMKGHHTHAHAGVRRCEVTGSGMRKHMHAGICKYMYTGLGMCMHRNTQTGGCRFPHAQAHMHSGARRCVYGGPKCLHTHAHRRTDARTGGAVVMTCGWRVIVGVCSAIQSTPCCITVPCSLSFLYDLGARPRGAQGLRLAL